MQNGNYGSIDHCDGGTFESSNNTFYLQSADVTWGVKCGSKGASSSQSLQEVQQKFGLEKGSTIHSQWPAPAELTAMARALLGGGF